MINIENTRQPLQELIKNSLRSFAAERPDVTWSTFALYSCPMVGWIMTCFNTEAKSAQIVAEFEKNGPDWYGEDQLGRFCNNCPDFEFFEWRTLDVPHWRSEYEETEPLLIRDLNGREYLIREEDGDEAINEVVFEFLRTVFLAELEAMKSSPYRLSGQRRFGVQLLDSTCQEFWQAPSIH